MKLVLPIVGVLLLVVLWVSLRARQRHRSPAARADPNAYIGLRNMALQGSRAKFGIPASLSSSEPYGVVMDWGVEKGTATVVALDDGTGSVYLSSGGGYIGGGQSHESIRTAAKKTVELAASVLPLMHLTSSYPLPERGQVTFYVLTDAGVLNATASEKQMQTHESPFSQLGDSMQAIVTEYTRMNHI
jgi:hypothetical protein